MNLRKKIHQAYDNIQVPEEVSERLKQQLYQKDFYQEEEPETEAFDMQTPEKRPILKYFGVGVAAAGMILCMSLSIWHILNEHTNEIFRPASTVPIEIVVTEETTETTEEFSTQP